MYGIYPYVYVVIKIINMPAIIEKTRFDTKLTVVQKELFEQAARLGGYRTLSDFVISTTQEKAKAIVEQHQELLASERDRKIFFDAMMNPPKIGERLLQAAERYRRVYGEQSKL